MKHVISLLQICHKSCLKSFLLSLGSLYIELLNHWEYIWYIFCPFELFTFTYLLIHIFVCLGHRDDPIRDHYYLLLSAILLRIWVIKPLLALKATSWAFRWSTGTLSHLLPQQQETSHPPHVASPAPLHPFCSFTTQPGYFWLLTTSPVRSLGRIEQTTHMPEVLWEVDVAWTTQGKHSKVLRGCNLYRPHKRRHRPLACNTKRIRQMEGFVRLQSFFKPANILGCS